jgi:hypothetical protein
MRVLKNVKNIQDIWNTADYVHKHVANALKNVEEWLDRLEKTNPSFFL